MAKENVIVLIGKITGNPTASFFEETGTYKVGWQMEVYRRNQRTDVPHVMIYGLSEESARNIYNDLVKKKDHFIMVRGMVSTRMENEMIKCSSCGANKEVLVLYTEVIAFAPPVFLEGNYDLDALKEFANNANIIGTVCSEPYARSSTNGTSMTQYQIAVHRRFRVKEQSDRKDDYPWVKCFANIAEDSAAHLKVGSQIYITGAIQTREVTRRTTCDECQAELSYPEMVGEIVPYDIEYLTNCVFADTEKDTSDNEETKEEPVNNE